MSEKKYTDEMLGEAAREAGTLVLVFAPLYVIFERSPASWLTLILALLIGSMMLASGIQIERKRR
jgi:hypothetical protein